MNSTTFTINNFRAFEQDTEISKRPITLNIGSNNCGKSTFSKFLELVKHSIITNVRENESDSNPFQKLHSFGNFMIGGDKEILNQSSNSGNIKFKIELPKSSSSFKSIESEITIQFEYVVKELEKNEAQSEDDKFDELVDNQFFFMVDSLPGQFPLVKIAIFYNNIELFSLENTPELFLIHTNPDIEESYKKLFINTPYLVDLMGIADLTSDEDKKILLLKVEMDESYFYRINVFSDLLKQLFPPSYFSNSFLLRINESISNFYEHLTKEFTNYNFIGLSRIKSGRKIDLLSNSLVLKGIEKYFTSRGQIEFNRAMEKILPLFELSKDFRITPHPDSGYVIKLKEENGKWRNLEDYGSGIKQLIPLFLLSTIGPREDLYKKTFSNEDLNNSYTFFIEEPEVNLHPNFQSKLADLFEVLHTKSKLDFVIETHSEYLVRRFQYLVGTNKLSPDDIVINYFWKENNITKCKQIYFKENGGLSDTFENGFYDERLQLQLELLLLNYSN
jgi:predicted ATPase